VDFSVGDKVIYPCHGVAVVTDIAIRSEDGEDVAFVVFAFAGRDDGRQRPLTVSLPAHRADDVGVRPVASPEDAGDVLAVLGVTDVRMPTNWSRRFKNHQEKMRSGDLFQYAEVVRNLAFRQRTANLAAAETAMYGAARHLLSSELAVTWSLPIDEAEARIDDALGRPALASHG
jgi:CarD family transcriptional regulator